MPTITHFTIEDLRFPTSLTGDGTDATNTECDYSAAYITLFTDAPLEGHGMTFTIGRGNDIVCHAIEHVAKRLVGKTTGELFGDMGAMWTYLCGDPQLRWLGPEKGAVALATGAVVNAVWDMYAKQEQKPLWQLITDFTPEEFVKATAFRQVLTNAYLLHLKPLLIRWQVHRYITDFITPEEALELLRAKEATKKERLAKVVEEGYPSYTTSVGWMGYTDEKVARLTREAIAQGWNHFKVKVGADLADDQRRLALVRSIIDDPVEYPPGRPLPPPATLAGKNASSSTGAVLMIDANQVFDVQPAIAYVSQLAQYKPWFIEEPTAPDDALGHAAVRAALKPHGIGVATGEHAHSRVAFKQLLQAGAIDVCQIDSCRIAGVNEVMAILLMAAKAGVPVCPHAGGVGLCEMVIHLSLIDYIAVSGSIDTNVLEYVDHLHEHFEHPCSINSRGRYNVPLDPTEGYSVQFRAASKAEFTFPTGSYWSSPEAKAAHNLV